MSLPVSSLMATSFRVNANSELSGVKIPVSEFHFCPVHSDLKELMSALCVKSASSDTALKTFLSLILYSPVGLNVFGLARPKLDCMSYSFLIHLDAVAGLPEAGS